MTNIRHDDTKSGNLELYRDRVAMLPEYVLAAMTAALLGWGGMTWKRSGEALDAARRASSGVDRVELKMAEQYLTKKEFELSMERLFNTLARFEEKLDYHVYEQDQNIRKLKSDLENARRYK